MYITDLTLERLASTMSRQSQRCPETDRHSENTESKTLVSIGTNEMQEKKEEVCEKCQQNQRLCEGNCYQETAVRQKAGCHSYCDAVLKLEYANMQRKCCKLELKAGNASHELCTRAGPCQAMKDINQGCCDAEIQGKGRKRGERAESHCRNCDKESCNEIGHGKEGCCGKNGGKKRGKDVCARKRDGCQKSALCNERSPGDDDSGEGKGLKTFDDPDGLLSPAEIYKDFGKTFEQGWHGSTEDSLSDTDVVDNITEVNIQSQNEMNQLNSKNYEEGTPSDYNPGQTYLPDFILLPNTQNYHDNYEDKWRDPRVECVDKPVDNEKDIDESGADSVQDSTRLGSGLKFLSLSGCYQITGEGLRQVAFFLATYFKCT